MNPDEIGNLARQTLTALMATYAGAFMTTNQESAIAAGLVALGSVLWSVYTHWNMKKVPENEVKK